MKMPKYGLKFENSLVTAAKERRHGEKGQFGTKDSPAMKKNY